jgi:hypothetical protein
MKRSVVLRLALLSGATSVVAHQANGQATTHNVGIQWRLNATGFCHDRTLTGGHVCLIRSKGDKVLWLLQNDCGDGVFQFTLKDKDPVTGCSISPTQPNFTIESHFLIKSGGHATISCVVHQETSLRTCEENDLAYTVNRVGMEKGSEDSKKRTDPVKKRISHELDLGVNP